VTSLAAAAVKGRDCQTKWRGRGKPPGRHQAQAAERELNYCGWLVNEKLPELQALF
jgi:hypothetical protein